MQVGTTSEYLQYYPIFNVSQGQIVHTTNGLAYAEQRAVWRAERSTGYSVRVSLPTQSSAPSGARNGVMGDVS